MLVCNASKHCFTILFPASLYNELSDNPTDCILSISFSDTPIRRSASLGVIFLILKLGIVSIILLSPPASIVRTVPHKDSLPILCYPKIFSI